MNLDILALDNALIHLSQQNARKERMIELRRLEFGRSSRGC
jgi:hypothetical protein